MERGRETRKRVRELDERADVQTAEPRRAGRRSMECSFEIAHVTWSAPQSEREPVVLGHASEPMS